VDYVLFGMGYGATLMLLGWALRTFGPERKYKDIDPENVDLTVARRRWVRFIQGLGGVIAIAGTAMVLFTFVVMLVNPDDETGGLTAMVIWGFLVIAILIWCWFYVSRFGLVGIWTRENGYGLVGGHRASVPRTTDAGLSPNRVIPGPRADAPVSDKPTSPVARESVDDPANVEPDGATDTTASDTELEEVAESVDPDYPSLPDDSSEENNVSDADLGYDFGDGSDTTVPSEIGGRSEAIRRLRERRVRTGNAADDGP
jgi:hypothetical protein